MVRVVGWVASLLGHGVRLGLLVLPSLLRIWALLLIAYGTWLFDERISYILAGLFILVFLQPPVRRKS